LDAQTQERGPSADTTRQPERHPQQTPEPARGAEAAQAEPSPGKQSWRERLREHWILASLSACVLLIALIGGVAYWLQVRHFESTDDAFVAARSFSVAPKVGGYVAAVPVTDNQHVNAGDLLARIDDRDYRIAIDQAQAQVAVAQANVVNIDAQIDSQQAQIDQARRSSSRPRRSFNLRERRPIAPGISFRKAPARFSAPNRQNPTLKPSRPTPAAPRQP